MLQPESAAGFLRIKPCAGWNFKIFLNSFFVKENQKLCPCMLLSGGNRKGGYFGIFL